MQMRVLISLVDKCKQGSRLKNICLIFGILIDVLLINSVRILSKLSHFR
jgi:hypothetical protein